MKGLVVGIIGLGLLLAGVIGYGLGNHNAYQEIVEVQAMEIHGLQEELYRLEASLGVWRGQYVNGVWCDHRDCSS